MATKQAAKPKGSGREALKNVPPNDGDFLPGGRLPEGIYSSRVVPVWEVIPGSETHGALGILLWKLQNELDRKGRSLPFKNDIFSMSHYSDTLDCDCGIVALKGAPRNNERKLREWEQANPHKSECALVQPFFACGTLEVWWHKHVGRSLELRVPVSIEEMRQIFERCEKSF